MKKLEAIEAALGRYIIEWNGMELALDMLVLGVRDRRHRNAMPHQLSNKTALVRKAACEENRLASLSQKLCVIADEIDSAAKQRHDFVHGAVIEFYEHERPYALQLGRLLQPPKRPRRRPVRVSAKILLQAAEEARKLGDQVLDLADVANKAGRS